MAILKLLALSVVLVACQAEPGPGTGENICGTSRVLRCPDDQYCDFGSGQSQVADPQGVCKAKPTVCTKEFKPVCGGDTKTYGNACEAARAGVSVDREGKCGKAPSL